MLGLPNEPFYLDEEAIRNFRNKIIERSGRKYEMWSRAFTEYKKNINLKSEDLLDYFMHNKEYDLLTQNWQFDASEKVSAREANGEIMQEIAKVVPNLIGGSSDLASSTKTTLKKLGDIKDEHYDGANIWFGVREHAMGAILNGLALTGFKSFGSTFLVFSDYLKPAIRLSALMNLPVNYIFTHDSYAVGQDGPTHQPIEQLTMLRSIPNLNVFRPADAKEIVGCWNMMLNTKGPNSLVLYRQESELIGSTSSEYVKYGAYPVRREAERLNGIIIATGSEVRTALLLAEQLYKENKIDLRVISMPCMELYEKQSEKYRQSLLPVGYKTIVIEAGASLGWYKYVYNEKYLMTIDRFGISGTKSEVEKELEYTFENLKERIKRLF